MTNNPIRPPNFLKSRVTQPPQGHPSTIPTSNSDGLITLTPAQLAEALSEAEKRGKNDGIVGRTVHKIFGRTLFIGTAAGALTIGWMLAWNLRPMADAAGDFFKLADAARKDPGQALRIITTGKQIDRMPMKPGTVCVASNGFFGAGGSELAVVARDISLGGDIKLKACTSGTLDAEAKFKQLISGGNLQSDNSKRQVFALTQKGWAFADGFNGDDSPSGKGGYLDISTRTIYLPESATPETTEKLITLAWASENPISLEQQQQALAVATKFNLVTDFSTSAWWGPGGNGFNPSANRVVFTTGGLNEQQQKDIKDRTLTALFAMYNPESIPAAPPIQQGLALPDPRNLPPIPDLSKNLPKLPSF
ncbi:MAG: hypothetical protein ACOYK8_09430 [Alphaproteobacteria bacterium]